MEPSLSGEGGRKAGEVKKREPAKVPFCDDMLGELYFLTFSAVNDSFFILFFEKSSSKITSSPENAFTE